MTKPNLPLADRILIHVEPDSNSGCWLWNSGTTKNGYGVITVSGRARMAHRVSYEEFVGGLPDNLLVCHRCDTPACVNPAHLFLGTHVDNMQDCVAKGRIGRASLAGERNGNAKLSERDVQAIRDEMRQPLPRGRTSRIRGTLTALARRYGVSVSLLHHIEHGYIWKDAA